MAQRYAVLTTFQPIAVRATKSKNGNAVRLRVSEVERPDRWVGMW